MSTNARLSLEEYESMAEKGVFDPRHPRHIELIRGELREFGEPVQLTLEEYERMVEAGVFSRRERRRLEFIRGEIRQMSPIGDLHAEVVDRLEEWGHDCTRAANIRIRVQNAIRLREVDSVPEPDISWVVKRDYSRGKPAPADILLVIEVADSSLEHDLGEKAGLYAAAGIRDYWVVDLIDRRIVVHRDPTADGYRDVRTCSGDEEIHPLAQPACALRVSSLWSATP
jgi:Uma2 family endonuclease